MNESFFKRVYALVKQVPKGKVVTYGPVSYTHLTLPTNSRV